MKALIVSIAALAASSSAFAVTAFFTGRQEMIQTVTYQSAWRCEYQYAGQKFWSIHQGSCPSSIEVR